MPIPPQAVRDLYDRTPGSKRMLVLRDDHQHFVDEVEREHETFRTMSITGPGARMPTATRPYAELCPAGSMTQNCASLAGVPTIEATYALVAVQEQERDRRRSAIAAASSATTPDPGTGGLVPDDLDADKWLVLGST